MASRGERVHLVSGCVSLLFTAVTKGPRQLTIERDLFGLRLLRTALWWAGPTAFRLW